MSNTSSQEYKEIQRIRNETLDIWEKEYGTRVTWDLIHYNYTIRRLDKLEKEIEIIKKIVEELNKK